MIHVFHVYCFIAMTMINIQKHNTYTSTYACRIITTFLSRPPGLLNRGPGGPASLSAGFLFHILSPTRLIPNSQSGAWGLPLLGAGFLYRILSPTDWISCALRYIIVQRPPSSCGRHKLHSFNASTVIPAIPRPDAPVIYTGAFPILTAKPGCCSIYNNISLEVQVIEPLEFELFTTS